jgi:arginyl-tRNA synthetase
MDSNLGELLRFAIKRCLLTLDLSEVDFSLEHPPQIEFGQFSSNVAMVGAKNLGKKPTELAEEIIAILKEDDTINQYIDRWQIAGPGFINAYVNNYWLSQSAEAILRNEYLPKLIGDNRTVILEYYQPNIAKPLHVGHMRSAILGDSMRRIFDLLGYKVISDTHMGDWGTQFGMLLYAYKQWGDRDYIEQDAIPRLLELYTKVNALAKEDETIREAGKNEFVLLEKKDPVNIEIWQWMVKVSMAEFMKAYELLNLKPHDVHLPESFYEDKMMAVVNELEAKNLIKVGETGEKYVDLEDEKLGRCMIIKSDGGTTYHLRDLATYLYRKNTFDFYKNIYFVDVRQAHHFEQLFFVLKKMGYPAEEDSCQAKFGFMTFAGNKLSTRTGEILKLSDMVKEVEDKAREVLKEKGRGEQDERVVKNVALASIKFFEFAHERTSDIDFNWDKVLNFEGKTGVYMLYGLARLRSIIKKAKEQKIEAKYFEAQNDLEISIGHLNGIVNEQIIRASDELSSHIIADHAYKIISQLNSWYDKSPILKETDKQLQSHRLAVVMTSEKVVSRLMDLLGIETVDEI